MAEAPAQPLVSVVILNYNGQVWMRRCLESMQAQTLFRQSQIIVADNASTDGSDRLAEELLRGWDNGLFIQNGANLGFCEGNNRGAHAACGEFLLFLNNDTWLDSYCLERLVEGTRAARADAASPLVLDYESGSFQTTGAHGFDLFGYGAGPAAPTAEGPILFAPGCALFIKAEVFRTLGGFDSQFFMYAEEADLGWRLTLAGYSTVVVRAARLYHRGAASANPRGGARVVEYRTTEFVRYQATRNSLLVLLKNTQHMLLVLVLFQLCWLALESFAVLVLTRQVTLIKRIYVYAIRDCWRMRGHVVAERRRFKLIRRRNDFEMLHFFRLRLGRWPEIKRIFSLGFPRISRSSGT